MSSSSKDLLHLEHKKSATRSSLESALLVCKKDSQSQTKLPPLTAKPIATTAPVAQSQVLGKVKDFLGVISEANRRLEQDAKDNSHKYDIEVITGNESEVIEMDLMLGIADLHTPEAVAAAESAIAHGQPVIPVAASSSETETEDTSDDDESDDEENASDSDDEENASDSDDFDNKNDHDSGIRPSSKDEASKCGQDSSSKALGSNRPNKRPKIVEMS